MDRLRYRGVVTKSIMSEIVEKLEYVAKANMWSTLLLAVFVTGVGIAILVSIIWRVRDWKNKFERRIALSGILIVVMTLSIPVVLLWRQYAYALLDYKDIKCGSYSEAEGIVTHLKPPGGKGSTVVTIYEDGQETGIIIYYGCDSAVGDKVTVCYLPHVEKGIIVEADMLEEATD